MNAATLIARSLHTGEPSVYGFDPKDRRTYDALVSRAKRIRSSPRERRTEFHGTGWTVILYERQRRQC